MPNTSKKVLLFANSYETFKWHRLSLAQQIKNSHEILLVLPNDENSPYFKEVNNQFKVINIDLNRKGTNPFKELKVIYDVYKIVKNYQPNIIHNFTIKCVLYGSIAGQLNSTEKIVNSITGLGYLFINQSLKARLLKRIASTLYRLIFKNKNTVAIFQNLVDQDLFIKNNLLEYNKAFHIPGSGVNLRKFEGSLSIPEDPNKLKFLFIGRLLKDKGVEELMSAIKKLRSKELNFEFSVAGKMDSGNPKSITEAQLVEIKRYFNYLGFIRNPEEIIKKHDVIVLPSYREGLSKTILEGMAAKKAIIAADVPGCRELVDDEKNGLLCQVKSSNDLQEKIEKLIKKPNLVEAMGQKSFEMVQDYEISKINIMILKTYEC